MWAVLLAGVTTTAVAWDGPVAGVWPWHDAWDGHDGTTLRVAAIQLTDFADGVNRTVEEETLQRTAKAVKYLAQAATMGMLHVSSEPHCRGEARLDCMYV